MRAGWERKTCSIGHLRAVLPLARSPEKISRSRLVIYSENDVDLIFRIANETGEMKSLDFSLALRRLVRGASLPPN
jgi:hypothetical protein